MKHILTLFAVLLLTACGTTGPVNLTKLKEPISANKARIVVERDNSLLYLAAAADVRANGVKIASLGRGGSVIHDIQKGKNTLSVSMPTAQGQYVVTFDAKAGELYEFMISPRGSNIMGGYGMGMLGDAINASVSEQSGYFRIGLKDASQ